VKFLERSPYVLVDLNNSVASFALKAGVIALVAGNQQELPIKLHRGGVRNERVSRMEEL